jgi:hypothetical protein
MSAPKLDGVIVACSWRDAHFNTDECDAGDTVHRPWLYVTVGILVRSDAEGLTVAMDQGEDGKYRSRTFVPRDMIIEEWTVGTVRPKVKRKRKETVMRKNAEGVAMTDL